MKMNQLRQNQKRTFYQVRVVISYFLLMSATGLRAQSEMLIEQIADSYAVKYPKIQIYAVEVGTKADTTIYTIKDVFFQEDLKQMVSYQKYNQKTLVSNTPILANKCNKKWLLKTKKALAVVSQTVRQNKKYAEVIVTLYDGLQILQVKVVNSQIVEKKWLNP